jgi:hypothetical protein
MARDPTVLAARTLMTARTPASKESVETDALMASKARGMARDRMVPVVRTLMTARTHASKEFVEFILRDPYR